MQRGADAVELEFRWQVALEEGNRRAYRRRARGGRWWPVRVSRRSTSRCFALAI